MAKWFGKVGYNIPVEKEPGIFVPKITEKEYFGDVYTDRISRQYTDVNDRISLNTIISIIADPFAYENFEYITYVEYKRSKWTITNVDPNDYPRLKITLSSRYLEDTEG